MSVIVLVAGLVTTATGAAMQNRFELPQPYLDWERAYLKDFPELQRVMDRMVVSSVRQMQDPVQDILHNRVCAALAYRMAMDLKLKRGEQKFAVLADLLHNISKEERPLVLTDSKVLGQASQLVSRLRQAGYLRKSPHFWTDETIFGNPLIGANRALVHHVTGALMAGDILQELGGYSSQEIARMQAAVIGHSTGYWYFRQSIDDITKSKDAWRKVYPEPEDMIARIAHDADLISQFEVVSVIPEGSKWRVIAAKRWGAKNAVEEGHVVYYVFLRLFEEARTEAGKALALAEWRKIRPELVKLMGLKADEDPVKVLGVPRAFQR
jgi:hypothetical protein